MFDPRKPRSLNLPALSYLIVDSNRFNRNLMADILGVLGANKVSKAATEDAAFWACDEKAIDIVICDWSGANEIDVTSFTRKMRNVPDDRIRRLPVIAPISETAGGTITMGRDAGIDEFLPKPIAPKALEERISMVVKTPRPFVDSKVYVGPCRRLKNSKDYYGVKRRDDDTLRDLQEMAAEKAAPDRENPVSMAVNHVELATKLIEAKGETALPTFQQAVSKARNTAAAAGDYPVDQALKAFEIYLVASTKKDGSDREIVQTGLSTLSQLTALPIQLETPRKTVARALSFAIKRKLAA